MRIAIVTYYFHPVKGGIENHCYNLAKYLAKNKHEVVVYTSNKTPNYEKLGRRVENVDGFEVVRLDNFWKFIPDFKKFDVIHLHNFNIFPHLWILTKTLLCKLLNRKRPKVIITLHGGFTPWWAEFSFLEKILKRLYHKTIGKFLLNYATDIIIAVSEWEKVELIKEGIKKRKIIVIPNGVEDLAYKLPKQKDMELEKYKPYLLFIGRICKIKRVHKVIKWFSRIREDKKLVIAGPVYDIDYYNYLKKLVTEFNLSNQVFFVGTVEGIKKYKLIDNSLALVLMSYNEVDPIIIKEAMARGKPVIVSKRTVFPYLIKNKVNGFLVETFEEFEKAIKELLYNGKLVKNIEKANKVISNIWKWENIGGSLEKLYLGLKQK